MRWSKKSRKDKFKQKLREFIVLEFLISFQFKSNDEIWNDFVKTGNVKGFSLEGYFADKLESKKELSKQLTEEETLIEQIKQVLRNN